jgi:hypothetical protein
MVFATPNFGADAYGTYHVRATVGDPSVASAPDEVMVSFTNVKPVANAETARCTAIADDTARTGEAPH